MQADQSVSILVQIGQPSSGQTDPILGIESVLRNRNHNSRKLQVCLSDCFEDVAKEICTADRVIIIFNQPPNAFPSRLLKLAMDRCAVKRSRMLHLVKNFDGTLVEHRRVERMFRCIDWTAELKPETKFQSNLDSENDEDDFSSLGEGFAWSIVINLLSDVLTQLEQKVRQNVGLNGSVAAERLREWNITGVDPSKILVVEKFFMIFDENQLALHEPAESDDEDARFPNSLFPGCNKLSSNNGPVKPLAFESPVYEKKIDYYLVELIDCLHNKATHAVIFCCYAAPTFAIRKLEKKTNEQKLQIFRDFKDEVKYILHHPKASELLRQFAVSLPNTAPPNEATKFVMIDIPSGNSQGLEEPVLKTLIQRELQEYCASLEVSHQFERLQVNKPMQADSSNALLLRLSPELDKVSTGARVEISKIKNVVVTDKMLSEYSLLDGYKIVLVLHTQDLASNLGIELRNDIRLAVGRMHRCGKYNIVLVIAAPKGENRPASFDRLPECLKHLPRSCVKYACEDISDVVAAISSIDPLAEGTNVEETLPLMSMAPSMIANLTIGLADRIKRYVQLKLGAGGDTEFKLPYCFVFPRSGECPDERKLDEVLLRPNVGAERVDLKFTEGGREINLNTYRWKSVTIAFEFPPSLRCIRSQAGCDFGGIPERQVRTNLIEFQNKLTLEYFDQDHGKAFNTSAAVDWDDLTGLAPRAWSDPGACYAESLLKRVWQFVSEFEES